MVAVLEIATRRFPPVLIASVAASAALLFVGCATPTPQREWKPAGYYITDQTVYGCDSFEGAKGTVVKKTALLSLSLQRRLLGLLEHAASADEEVLREMELEDPWQLTGLYRGRPIGEQSIWSSGDLPSMIHLFRRPLLEEWAETGVALEDLVAHVVIHEIGHHFGFSDEEMQAIEDGAG